MSKQTEGSFVYPPYPGIPDLPGFEEGRKFFLAAVRFQAEACKAAIRYQIEALDFLKCRCERDMKLVEDLVADDEFVDAFDVVTDFMQEAAVDYAKEAGKVAGIGSRLAADAARRVQKQAETTVEDLAARTVA